MIFNFSIFVLLSIKNEESILLIVLKKIKLVNKSIITFYLFVYFLINFMFLDFFIYISKIPFSQLTYKLCSFYSKNNRRFFNYNLELLPKMFK